jgi:hypothetical protein
MNKLTKIKNSGLSNFNNKNNEIVDKTSNEYLRNLSKKLGYKKFSNKLPSFLLPYKNILIEKFKN